MDINGLGFLGVFFAGVLSFVSPCVFPLIPAYLAQITGLSSDDLFNSQDQNKRRTVLSNSIAFVLGLSVVFTLLGASATFVGRFLVRNQDLVTRVAGFAIVLFGLHMLEVVRIPWLMREARVDFAKARKSTAGPLGSFFMGGAFGVGWTPCIGPVLASVLAIASQTDSVGRGMGLLLTYSLGLGLPFILVALVLNRPTGRNVMKRVRRLIPQLSATSGVLLIGMGLLVFTGNLITLSNWITKTFGMGFTL